MREAVIKAVSPPGRVVLGSAPASRSSSTSAWFPFVQAKVSGVTPYRFAAFTRAPAPISSLANSRSSWRAAQCKAVIPSTWGAFTTAGSSSRARIRSRSIVSAASASGAFGAPTRLIADNSQATAPTLTCFTVMAPSSLIPAGIRSTAVPRPSPCCRRRNPCGRPPSRAASGADWPAESIPHSGCDGRPSTCRRRRQPPESEG